jgi:hypothetical protein
MKVDDDASHLHAFPSGSSGTDRLLSVLQSEHTSSGSKFKGKKLHYVYEEKCQHELMYSDFIWIKNEDYITSHVVNAYFWLLDQTFNNAKFGDSFVHSGMLDEFHDDDKLKKVLLAMWPENTNAIFLPLNINNNHWIVAVIDKNKKKRDVYD